MRSKFIQLTVVDDINAKAVEAWKQKRSIVNDMYTLILLILYNTASISDMNQLIPFHIPWTQIKHMLQSAYFSLTFWLAILSELYLGAHLPLSKINTCKNKIKSEHGSHICTHTTYNSIMFTYNICKPDDKCRVNTDLPPLKSGEH
jgi:hypothetical protein